MTKSTVKPKRDVNTQNRRQFEVSVTYREINSEITMS